MTWISENILNLEIRIFILGNFNLKLVQSSQNSGQIQALPRISINLDLPQTRQHVFNPLNADNLTEFIARNIQIAQSL